MLDENKKTTLEVIDFQGKARQGKARQVTALPSCDWFFFLSFFLF